MDKEDVDFAAHCTAEFLDSLIESNQQQRTQAFYEIAFKLSSEGVQIPVHWTAFMAQRLLDACNIKQPKSDNPIADVLGIGKFNDEARDINIGILVGYFLAIQKDTAMRENVSEASRQTEDWLYQCGIELNYKTISKIYNASYPLYDELAKMFIKAINASGKDLPHFLSSRFKCGGSDLT